MSGDGDDGSDFRDAVKGVRPLERGRRRPEPAPGLRRPAGEPPGEPVAFAMTRFGERVEGLAPGVDRQLLARLADGRPEPEARIDLHGLDAVAAERRVREGLLAAHDTGLRCVLVIHGRGRRSEGPAVLKEAFPDWLAGPLLGPRILAFTTAKPEHGGTGASYVLLRSRARRP